MPFWILAAALGVAVVAVAAGWASPAQAAVFAVVSALAAAGARFAQGRTEAILAAEVARRREAEQEARQANRAKSEFLANMSHELRTPLAAIIGSADLLRRVELPADDRHHLEVVDNSAEALLALIDDILDFAKLEAGRLRLAATDFRLRELIEGVRALLAPAAADKDLELIVSVDDGVRDAVRGDPARLRQVLVNLAGNAIKFTAQGRVDILVAEATSAAGEPRTRFTVRDTGIGISAGDQRRIFETFYQAESLSARRFGGSGLGLAISHELVRRMGGEMGLKSERGVGSTFWVDLPLEPARAEVPGAADEPAPAMATVDRGRFRILVVDDSANNRRLALSHLKALGYRASAAEDGKAALARLAAEPFDAVLMDCQMPDLDGYETARRWRHLEAERAAPGTPARTPIVALTAHVLPGEREKCLAVGMDDYLAKPYRGADLERVLRKWLHGETVPVDEADASGEAPPSSFDERIDALRRLGEATGEDVLGPTIETFSADASRLLGEMRLALDGGEGEALAQAAHGLISTSGVLGAERLVDLLRRIEARALAGRLDGLGELLEAAESAIEGFVEKLEAIHR